MIENNSLFYFCMNAIGLCGDDVVHDVGFFFHYSEDVSHVQDMSIKYTC